MSAEPSPCRCGAVGIRNLGTSGYCVECLLELFESFSPEVYGMAGRYMSTGAERPDHGPGYAECNCPACGARAVALPGQECGYCLIARERMVEWQATKVLTPPPVDELTDERRPAAIEAWADRLAIAVKAEIIEERVARRAWDRAVGDVAA